jgi:SAM-dependent methyltransferase
VVAAIVQRTASVAVLKSANADVEIVPCNLCGGEDFERLFEIGDQRFDRPEVFAMVRCRSCGLGFLSPRPKESALQQYYPPAYFDEFKVPDYGELYQRRADFLGRACASLKARRLLDVGCANGAFPRFMRDRGWTVEGIEVADTADSIVDFPVYRRFAEIPASGARYDAISAWSVLEYMPDPDAVFHAVSALLVPGGAWIIVTPNFDSITAHGLRRYDVPRQLYCFSPPAIQAYAAKAGLSVDTINTDARFFMKAPNNWLRYYLRRAVGLGPLPWNRHPEGRLSYARRRNLSPGFYANVQYAITHPLTSLDRALEPAFQRCQEWAGTYGFATFVIRKPPSASE